MHASPIALFLFAFACASSLAQTTSQDQSAAGASDSDLTILNPTSGATWTSRTQTQVSWSGTAPAKFNIQVLNDNNRILANGISVANNVDASKGSVTLTLGDYAPADNYHVRFYSVSNISTEYARSGPFRIQRPAHGTVTSNSTGWSQSGGGNASAGASAAAGAGAGASSANSSTSNNGSNGTGSTSTNTNANGSNAATAANNVNTTSSRPTTSQGSRDAAAAVRTKDAQLLLGVTVASTALIVACLSLL
ncbi:Ser-Thr-rich glycosyl-phosphatidyl-inositol-anchored membrane family [Ceraceosorus bombacis]|uniref:Ser-Thr-rich glycosyl-phosphatidyl-inositol-anchored membrane family n=1 Tax=Ceraceosorus bombacis TaxID=401625 RepID=A0A0P1BDU2_9BASI|nr:Ser-Thr-rich glycosyl-phosphatidyl-inositol-anchored membrane family [Ceraceosorus bombacis]